MIDVRITGPSDDGQVDSEPLASIHTKNGITGQNVFTEKRIGFDPVVAPFFNDTFGTAMNQAVVFTGTPELIHDGGDNVGWTPTAIQGTWDFSDSLFPFDGANCVFLSQGDNGDEASFADPGSTDMSVMSAITGQLRLTSFNPANNQIIFQFLNNGLNVGDPIILNNFINTGLTLAYQGFVIPKTEFDLITGTVDELKVTVVRSGGPKPSFRLDVLQIEESGEPLNYISTIPKRIFHVKQIKIAIANNITATEVDGTMDAIDPNLFLDLPSLANGLTFTRVQNGQIVFAVPLRTLGDFDAASSSMSSMSKNSNTQVTFSIDFEDPIILNGTDLDFLAFTVADNLSSLTRLTAIARGSVEIEP